MTKHLCLLLAWVGLDTLLSADSKLPQCLAVTNSTAEGASAPTFRIRNSCTRAVNAVAYTLGWTDSKGFRQTVLELNEFGTMTPEHADFPSGFGGDLSPGKEKQSQFPLPSSAGLTLEVLKSAEIVVLAVAYMDGASEGLSEYVDRLVEIKRDQYQRITRELQFTRLLSEMPSRYCAMSNADRVSAVSSKIPGISNAEILIPILNGYSSIDPEFSSRWLTGRVRHLERSLASLSMQLPKGN